ncbi:MAG TPA: glycosyltransferase, partial [Rubrivivax sp.]|nr:glycosyltransferase [Rubrivivax sp.]
RRIRRRQPRAVFRILGSVGADNPTAIPADEVHSWVDEGVVELLGTSDDVRPAIAAAHAVVLPSYREGVPRVLLEAAAMARPCIATDVPGCRDAVVDASTGLLCAPRDAAALADAIQRFIDAGPASWVRWGEAGRAHVQSRFDEREVIETYRRLAHELAGGGA